MYNCKDCNKETSSFDPYEKDEPNPAFPYCEECKNKRYVSETIMQQIETGNYLQLGGVRVSFFKFAGASEFLYDENSLRFKVSGPTFKGKIWIKLNGSDYYDVEFWQIKHKTEVAKYKDKVYSYTTLEPTKTKEFNDIDCEQLGPLLASEIGLK